MRRAEIVAAAILAIASVALMVKAAENAIGWVPEAGPGAGAFPFWLGFGMLLSSLAILYRGIKGLTPESRSTEPYMDRHTAYNFVVSAGSVGIAIALIHVIGVYFVMPLFFIFYIRVFGGMSWRVTAPIAVLSPVAMFMLFEMGLQIILPKGYTAPLFYPIYAIVY